MNEVKSAAKGESATKRQTRSVHEKQRRIEMNTVLSEMFDLLQKSPRVARDDDDARDVATPPPKKPDKCWIIGKAVDAIRAAPPQPVAHYSDFFADVASPEVVVFEIRDLVVANMMGDATAIFGVAKSRMLGRDFRAFLDFDSGVNFRVGAQKMWCSVIGRKFSTFWKDNFLICFGETMRLVEERPILAALLSTPTTTTHEHSSTKPNPANVGDTTTLTPSLHCDDASSSSAFLSPQSTSSSSRSRKSSSQRRATTRKRLRSMNVIVETYALDATTAATKVAEPLATTATSHVPALISPTPLPINPYDVLAPGYRDIWLRLQSERILLEQRVLAKERELQTLMMATSYSNPT